MRSKRLCDLQRLGQSDVGFSKTFRIQLWNFEILFLTKISVTGILTHSCIFFPLCACVRVCLCARVFVCVFFCALVFLFVCLRCERMYPSLNTPNLLPPNIYLPWKRLDPVVHHKVCALCVGPNRRDGNGMESKMKASIRQYVVRQHAGAHGGIHTSENVSMKRKKSSEYAPHSSTANHMQSAPTRIANMKGKSSERRRLV